MHRWNQQPSSRIIVAVVLALSVVAQFTPLAAQGANLQVSTIRLDRMKVNTATGATVCAQPPASNTGTEDSVVITFPSTYTLNTTAANWTVTTTNQLTINGTTGTAWPGIGTATAVDNTGKTVTFPSTNLTAGTLYCFSFSGTSTLTTANSVAASQQASIQTRDSGSAQIDFAAVALANITDDQIAVTAVVPPTFDFTLSGNADPFQSNLSPTGIISTTGVMVQVITNAKGGWIAWAKSTNAGLTSTAASYTIPSPVSASPTTLVAGTEGYVMDVNETLDAVGGCTLAVSTGYDGATTSAGGTLTTSFSPIAACTPPPSPATANGDQITLIERAAISGATPAGSDYADIITVVGAGNF